MAMQASKSQDFHRMANDKFISEVVGIGDTLRLNQVSNTNGRETRDTKRVDEAYRQFTSELKDQREWMKNASDAQKEVFHNIIGQMMQMRKDGNYEFAKHHKEFQASAAMINEVDGSAEARHMIEKIAAIGMQHTDPQFHKKKGGILRQEMEHRMSKMFEPTAKDLESPLFRRLSGMDKAGPGKISALREMQNLGNAEAVKRKLGEDIMGPHQDSNEDPDAKLVQKIAMVMGGKGGSGGNFPNKIENLYVENLIFKNGRREEGDKQAPFYVPPTIGGNGRSAVPVGHPELPPPSGVSAAMTISPQLPPPSGAMAALVPHPHGQAPSGSAAMIEHQEGNYLPAMMPGHRGPPEGMVKVKRYNNDDAEDVEYREIHGGPIKQLSHAVKPQVAESEPIRAKGNPGTPLRTGLTPMASAVAGAIAAAPTMAIGSHPTLVDTFKDDYKDNDSGPRDADATRNFDSGGEGKGGGIDPTDLLSMLPGLDMFRRKPKGDEEKAKGEEEKSKGKGEEEKTKAKEEGKAEAKEKVGGDAEKLKEGSKAGRAGEAAEGIAGEAKAASKVLKGLSHAGNILGIAGAGIQAYQSFNEYQDVDAAQKSGKITAEQAKNQKGKAVGGGAGAIGGGLAGAEAGGAAGAAIGTMIFPGVGTVVGGLIGAGLGAWGGSELGEAGGRKVGGWVAGGDPSTGKAVNEASAAHKEATTKDAKAPVIVHAPTTNVTTGGSGNDLKVMPITGSPRSRESYFDRAMMGTLVF